MAQADQEELSGRREESTAAAGFLRRNRVDLALVLLVFAVFGPIVAANSAQPASRINLTAAVVEHRTVDVAGYPHGVDYARYNGKLRSDKGPGQPLLAAPFYAIERVFGAESATHLRQHRDLTLWWVTFWSATVPFAALLVLVRRTATRFAAPRVALLVTLVLGFATVLTPYAANLYAHVLAALLAYGAWLLLDRSLGSRAKLVWSGLLAGLAVTVEYQVGLVAIALLIAAFVFEHRRAWWFVLGAIPPALALGVYQWRAFGAPWRLPFGYFAGTIGGTTEGGYTIPGLHGFADVLIGGGGLILVSPLVLLGIAAAVVAARRPDFEVRRHGWMALAVAIPYIVLVAGWSGTPTLEVPGPRYLSPMVPFLAVPLCVVWSKWRKAIVITVVIGAALQLTATVTDVLLGQHQPIVQTYRARLAAHEFLPTIWSIGFGELGILLYVAVVALAIWFLVRTQEEPVAV